MLNFIYGIVGSIIRFFYDLFGNYTLALLFFTIVFQIILLPLGIKQQKNQVKQASLQPKIMAIRKKYAGRTDQATQQKMQQETMDLYQRENFNPAGGCLPLLIQLPVIMLLYTVVRSPLSYILKYTPENIETIKNLVVARGQTIAEVGGKLDELDLAHKMTVIGEGAFESLGLKFPDFTLFGLDLTQAPIVGKTVSDPWLLIIPIVTFIAMYGSQFIIRKFSYQSPEVKEQQKSLSMKLMNISMPLMSVYFAAVWPGTLGVYWIFRNILQTIQQIILAKAIPVPQFTEEDFKAAERELAGKSKKKGEKKADAENGGEKKKVRSLHYIDEDEEDYPELPEMVEREIKSESSATEKKSGGGLFGIGKKKSDENGKSSGSMIESAPLKDEDDKN